MIAIHTVYPPRLAAQHQPHDQLAQPAAHAMRSPSERMPANISHLFLHYALRAYRRLAGAAVLASVLKSFATTFTLIVTRQPCPGPAERVRQNKRSVHLEVALLTRSARPSNLFVAPAHTSRRLLSSAPPPTVATALRSPPASPK